MNTKLHNENHGKKHTISVQHNGYGVDVVFYGEPDPDRVTLFCIPLVSSYEYGKILALASSYGIPAMAVDPIGHGESSVMRCMTTGSVVMPTLEDQVAVFWNLVEQLNLRKVFLLGYSMGGHIALQMAIADKHKNKNKHTVGLMISETSPTTLNANLKKTLPEPRWTSPEIIALLTKLEPMTPAEADLFAECHGFKNKDLRIFSYLAQCVRGGARNIMNDILTGRCADEIEFFLKTSLPIAVIGGDCIVNSVYLDALVQKRKNMGNSVEFGDMVRMSESAIWDHPVEVFDCILAMYNHLE